MKWLDNEIQHKNKNSKFMTLTRWFLCRILGLHRGAPQDQFFIQYKCIDCKHEWERW